MSADTKTTAHNAGAFYKDLLRNGIPAEVADRIVFETVVSSVREFGYSIPEGD